MRTVSVACPDRYRGFASLDAGALLVSTNRSNVTTWELQLGGRTKQAGTCRVDLQ